MITDLDDSHRVVLKNWREIEQMSACCNEVEEYLMRCVLSSFERLRREYPGMFAEIIQDWNAKNRFVQFPPRAPQAGFFLGMECISSARLLRGEPGDCLVAYAFSHVGPDHAKKLRSAAPVPGGFSSKQRDELYIFWAELPTISLDDFVDREKLVGWIVLQMQTLCEWYRTNEKSLLEACR